jgi:hypothetical protein
VRVLPRLRSCARAESNAHSSECVQPNHEWRARAARRWMARPSKRKFGTPPARSGAYTHAAPRSCAAMAICAVPHCEPPHHLRAPIAAGPQVQGDYERVLPRRGGRAARV